VASSIHSSSHVMEISGVKYCKALTLALIEECSKPAAKASHVDFSSNTPATATYLSLFPPLLRFYDLRRFPKRRAAGVGCVYIPLFLVPLLVFPAIYLISCLKIPKRVGKPSMEVFRCCVRATLPLSQENVSYFANVEVFFQEFDRCFNYRGGGERVVHNVH
jgi:hypothetical protein